jgi:urease accessory protein
VNSLSQVHGTAHLLCSAQSGQTRLTKLYQQNPLRVLFPSVAQAEPLTATLLTTSGGLVGGDQLEIEVGVEAGASMLVTTQAAEKVYGSAGSDCILNTQLSVDSNCWLEWLPQETIFFEGARMRRLTQISLKPQARLLAGDILVFGRTARGEKLTQGFIRDVWEVRRDERLLWADALHLSGDLQKILNAPAGFNGCIAYATIVYAAENAKEQLEWARSLLKTEKTLYCAATEVGGLLIMRWLAHDALRLRNAYGAFWAAFRNQIAGLPSTLPRLWYV